MASELPSLETAAVWPHDRYSYENYKTVHHRYMMNLLDEGMVEENGLVFEEFREGRTLLVVNIAGRVHCTGGITVEVDKWLEAQPSPTGYLVKGVSYSYQAWLAETGQEVMRYDSAHGLDDLHCHLFDLSTGEETRLPCPLNQLPSLDGFIRLAIKRLEDAQA